MVDFDLHRYMFRNERKARKLVLIDTCCDLKLHSHNLTFYPTSSSKLLTAATSTTTCVTVPQQLMLLQFWGAHLYHSWCYAIGAQCFFEACVCVYVCVSVCFRPRPLSIRSSNRSLFSFSNVSPLPPVYLSLHLVQVKTTLQTEKICFSDWRVFL